MTIDITTMLINLSNSMRPVQSLLSGMGYFIGIIMVISGLIKLRKVGEKGQSGSDGLTLPLAFICGGGLLIYLPSSFDALSNTLFGATNILSYSGDNGDPFYHAMELIIETAGLVWFVRGTVLLVNSSKPGEKEGSKGMTFLIAGICAMNFDNSVAAITYALSSFFTMMSSVKSNA